MGRKKTPVQVETALFDKSRRRCCVCFSLQGDFSQKKGQIAHLDRNPANAVLENLAWLCLDHHDEYDSITSQSKGLTTAEVKFYRDELYQAIQEKFAVLQVETLEEASSNLWTEDMREVLREMLGNKIADKMIKYRGYGPFIGLCRLRIYKESGRKPVIIVTQFPDNPGTSITNVAEGLARQVYVQELKRPDQGMTWIEHYTQDDTVPESYMLVTFRQVGEEFSDPKWEDLTVDQVQALVGAGRI